LLCNPTRKRSGWKPLEIMLNDSVSVIVKCRRDRWISDDLHFSYLFVVFLILYNMWRLIPILTTVEIFVLQAVNFFKSAKNITMISIASYPKKSYHPYKWNFFLIVFSNSKYQISCCKREPCLSGKSFLIRCNMLITCLSAQ
jgi:hypothetical protein